MQSNLICFLTLPSGDTSAPTAKQKPWKLGQSRERAVEMLTDQAGRRSAGGTHAGPRAIERKRLLLWLTSQFVGVAAFGTIVRPKAAPPADWRNLNPFATAACANTFESLLQSERGRVGGIVGELKTR